jgi:hypothetical protein
MEIYERVEDDQRGARVMLQPKEMPLLGSTQYIAHQAKIWQDNTLTYSMCLIVSTFPWSKKAFGRETRSIGKVILLSLHPYKEHPKRSPYVISTMILVRIVPRIRINLSKSY